MKIIYMFKITVLLYAVLTLLDTLSYIHQRNLQPNVESEPPREQTISH